ncbi:MAG: hypothetical protein ABR572_11580, partial [Cryomorphaceae bacterium]
KMSMPDKSLIKEYGQNLLPFLILAAALRLWNFGEMPFINDELSALQRTDFPDLAGLIKHGVAPDAHPALTQVFLWIWVQLFGTDGCGPDGGQPNFCFFLERREALRLRHADLLCNGMVLVPLCF